MAAVFLRKAGCLQPDKYKYSPLLDFSRSILHVTTKIANNVSLNSKSGGGNLLSHVPLPRTPFPGPLLVSSSGGSRIPSSLLHRSGSPTPRSFAVRGLMCLPVSVSH